MPYPTEGGAVDAARRDLGASSVIVLPLWACRPLVPADQLTWPEFLAYWKAQGKTTWWHVLNPLTCAGIVADVRRWQAGLAGKSRKPAPSGPRRRSRGGSPR